MRDNKLWNSHRIVLPEAREVIVKQCCECRFFVTIRGVRETRQGCVAEVRKYRTLSVRVPSVIHVMEVMKTEGKDGLANILEKGDPLARACGLFQPRLKNKIKP
jgi:hypothetical protein